MDVALSIVAGLGLRLAFFSAGSSRFIQALLGLWEGIVIHQVSGRSSAPKLDHILAFVLRVSLDLLFSKDFLRTFMILIWTALGTVGSEAVYPHTILRAELKKQRDRERRHRHSHSALTQIPISSTPLPPRVRAYRHPDQHHIGSELPADPPIQSSTPFVTSMPPPTPPSVFLHEESNIYSPPPKPIQIEPFPQESIHDALPVRPPSGLAQLLENSPDTGSPLPLPIPLPTPPESSQSAVPSDGVVRNDLRTPRLSTIHERTSEENVSPEPNEQEQNGHAVADFVHLPTISGPYAPSAAASSAPLPVPNPGLKHTASNTTLKWLASQSAAIDESIFIPPIPSSLSPVPPIPEPLPVRLRHQPSWDAPTPTMNNHNNDIHEQDDQHSDEEHGSDELYTPGAREKLNVLSDNEYAGDPLQSPQVPAELSPLVLNVKSAMTSDEHIPHSGPEHGGFSEEEPEVPQIPHVVEDEEEDENFMPGSISQNLLLQPPLPPSGPLIRPPSPSPQPSPPSPATILSNGSERSTFTTLYPSKLYSRADELRKQARAQEQTRADLENERKKADAQGRVLDALALKIKIRDLDAEAQKLHEKAARRYYAARNALQVSSKIDVHGLRPREAFDRAERALLEAINQKRPSLRIIVGKGNHSVNNQPTLKPTILREMTRLGFRCEVDPRNAGVLIVTIPQSESTSNATAGPSRR
ncbi:hypothetical protein CVT24_001596 [Panaeolus cyanescens]|uniref:Smr domain-containing protein n=1 Tax=Panaeolus cyanescens TaxID=181874 RepID=A0A409YFD9_9AGAR|nr:hypothetical protein CVT24_001596 [Panaeolus cyanescens]